MEPGRRWQRAFTLTHHTTSLVGSFWLSTTNINTFPLCPHTTVWSVKQIDIAPSADHWPRWVNATEAAAFNYLLHGRSSRGESESTARLSPLPSLWSLGVKACVRCTHPWHRRATLQIYGWRIFCPQNPRKPRLGVWRPIAGQCMVHTPCTIMHQTL